MLQKLQDNKIGLNTYALSILNHIDFKTSIKREKIETVEVSVKDLGFPAGATLGEIYQKAKELGLNLCPAELGPHLRLQYLDPSQPNDPDKGNWQTIATEKLSTEPDFPAGFYLRRLKDQFWLRGYQVSADYAWNPADRFIFVQQ